VKAGRLISKSKTTNHVIFCLKKMKSNRIKQFIIKKNGKNKPKVEARELSLIGM
jgi:DNA-binding protein